MGAIHDTSRHKKSVARDPVSLEIALTAKETAGGNTMKIFMCFINTIYWLWLFIVPILPVSVIGIWLYDRSTKNIPYIIILVAIAAIAGFVWAESVRKKRGLSIFFASILNTPDIPGRASIGLTDDQETKETSK